MKLFNLYFLILLLYCNNSFGGDAPKVVQLAFEQKFPNAGSVKWDKENAHEYEASFSWNGLNYSANFKDSGEWLETESPLEFGQLPTAVQSAVNASWKSDKIKTVCKIINSKGQTKFEIELKKGLLIKEIFYDEKGTEIQ